MRRDWSSQHGNPIRHLPIRSLVCPQQEFHHRPCTRYPLHFLVSCIIYATYLNFCFLVQSRYVKALFITEIHRLTIVVI